MTQRIDYKTVSLCDDGIVARALLPFVDLAMARLG